MTKPVEGREQDFNDWYQNIHLRDVVAVEAFKSAQRFRLNQSMVDEPSPWPYMAIYDVETDDIDGAIAELKRRAGTDRMVISDAMAPQVFASAYEEFGPAVKS